MSVHVRQSLLYRSEQCDLDIPVHPSKRWGQFEIHLDSASLREAVHVPTSRRPEPRFIQQRRMQEIGDGACLGQALVHNFATFRKQCGLPIVGRVNTVEVNL